LTRFSQEKIARFIIDGEYGLETERALEWIQGELGVAINEKNARMVRGIAAVRAGATLDEVGKTLTWKEFESFCAALLRAKGFEVLENLTLTKPRVQIDIVARTPSVALVVDCKHWAKDMGQSSLDRVVMAQAKRARILRAKMPQLEPMVVVVVSLSDETGRYVRPGVVVPIHTLADFVSGLSSYTVDIPRF
jgi:Holliday junction resolvase-like predicted endonuclease